MSDEALAFWFHGPGLRLLGSYRMSTRLVVVNLAAIALTFALAVPAFLYVHPALGIALWLGGHFGWSVYLASVVRRERVANRSA